MTEGIQIALITFSGVTVTALATVWVAKINSQAKNDRKFAEDVLDTWKLALSSERSRRRCSDCPEAEIPTSTDRGSSE